MSFVARSRCGNACGTRRAATAFKPAFIPSRDRDFRLLRMEGNEGDLAFESSARARAPRLRLGFRVGQFQFSLSHGKQRRGALFRRRFVRGTQRFSCRARPDGRGQRYQIFSAARAFICILRCRERRLYSGKNLRRRRRSAQFRNAVSLRHAERENILYRRRACNFNVPRLRALSLADCV